MRLLRLIPVLFICLFLTGGHYGMLQCVAWAGMLWNYSEQDGLAQGARDTFSGDKPCCLCEAIAEAQQGDSESQEPIQRIQVDKLKNLQCPQTVLLKAPVAVDLPSHTYPEFHRVWNSHFEAPLSPPPRLQA